MQRKVFLILVATVLIVAMGIQLGFCQEQEEGTVDTAEIMDKLDEVLTNQAEMLRQFEQIRQELTIIKIRATR